MSGWGVDNGKSSRWIYKAGGEMEIIHPSPLPFSLINDMLWRLLSCMALWIQGRAWTWNKGSSLPGNIFFMTRLIAGLAWSSTSIWTRHENVWTHWCGHSYSLKVTHPLQERQPEVFLNMFIEFPIMESTALLISHRLRQFDPKFQIFIWSCYLR